MKTNYTLQKLSLYSILGFLGLAAASCGSYQSASTYDKDGIYGTVPKDTNNGVYTAQNGEADAGGQNTNYKAYFQDMQDEYPAFTDTENYSSYGDTVVQVESYNAAPGWGEDTENVTVNVYGGYSNYGWGGYPWYGGWGWNNWYGGWGGYSGWSLGWGWGGGWYSPYYYGGGWGGYYGGYYGGYPRYYGSSYGNNYYGNGVRTRSNNYFSGGRAAYYNGNGRYAAGRSRNALTSVNGRRSTFNPATRGGSFTRSGVVRSRGNATSVRSTSNSPRFNSSSTRSNNTFTPSRSGGSTRSSSTISTPSRSSSSGGFGGGRSSGGSGGGGRSSGGGGGRRG